MSLNTYDRYSDTYNNATIKNEKGLCLSNANILFQVRSCYKNLFHFSLVIYILSLIIRGGVKFILLVIYLASELDGIGFKELDNVYENFLINQDVNQTQNTILKNFLKNLNYLHLISNSNLKSRFIEQIWLYHNENLMCNSNFTFNISVINKDLVSVADSFNLQ